MARFSASIMRSLSRPRRVFSKLSPWNSLTLRGWNKFDVAPLGGSRLAYASLEYHYSCLAVYYDTGKVWDPG